MKNIIFNRSNDKVAGLNRLAFSMEYAVQIPYVITLSKTVTEVQGEKQKVNDQSLLLFLDGENEVTESKKAVTFEEVEHKYMIDGKEVVVPGQVPTEWEDLQPVMVPNEVYKTVNFQENPFEFTYEEVLEAKKAALQGNNLRKLVHYDEDFNLAGFSTDLASHTANMGDGILALHPNGQCRTEKIQLSTSAQTVQIYLESHPDVRVEVGSTASNFIEVIDGIAVLPQVSDAIYVRFINQSDRFRDVFAFGILV